MDTIFESVFASSMNIGGTFASIGAALACGLLVAWICSFRLRTSKGVFITGALMPAIIATVFIFMGYFLSGSTTITARLLTLAVAFGLLRFRSAPAKAEEILFLFISVALGAAFGLGYIAYGVIIGVALALSYFGLTYLPVFSHSRFGKEKLLLVTIPESLDYTDIFNATFGHYASKAELVGVKTTNMGSLFRLSYRIVMKDLREEKEMIDELRTKNGNLEISLLPYVEDRNSL
ncbi:MAG: DUF4956 domain-containing protein [Bacilli bacterium]|nr:DUF4956 domain-containing protein [Bacilli bacterium]